MLKTEVEKGYGLFETILPFCKTQIRVPCILAIFLARRAAAGIARFTDSKNRLFSGDVVAFFMVLLQSVKRCLQNYRKSSKHPQSVDKYF